MRHPESPKHEFRGNLNNIERLCPDRNELEATNLSIGVLTEIRDDLTISVGVKVHSTGASVALSAGDDCLKLLNPLPVNVRESRLKQSSNGIQLRKSKKNTSHLTENNRGIKLEIHSE